MEKYIEKKHYTFADCLAWNESDRIELIHGQACTMSLPMRIHQEISGRLLTQLANYLEGKTCEVYPAPFGVRLFEKDGDSPEDVDTMVEPDITVICDRNKLDDYGCKGAPDLIIEIMSPSTRRHDRITKFRLYQSAGVREYWLVDPQNRTVEVYTLDENKYLRPCEVYSENDMIKVTVLDECTIDLKKVFPNNEK